MKKRDILSLLYQLAAPVLLMVLGVILLLNPDTASVLIARLLGWALTLVGICIGISAIADRRRAAGKGVAAVLCVLAGGYLSAFPLVLAAGIGRLLGVLILLRGLWDGFVNHQHSRGQALSAITTVVGFVLIVLPLTTSRLVFSICGGVILALGIAMLLDRLKNRKYLDSGDPNIIDAL